MKDWYEFKKSFKNNLRESLGFEEIGHSLVKETALKNILEKLIYDQKMYQHYRPDFLEGLELDLYFPELKIAIEYQGKQHFEAIEYFGGEEAFRERVERDKRKHDLCCINGIKLIYINYTDDLEEINIRKILKRNGIDL